jgi:hypothetical protein
MSLELVWQWIIETRVWALHMFYRRSDYLDSTRGSADRGRPVVLDGYGFVSYTQLGGYFRKTIAQSMTIPADTYLIATDLTISSGVTLTMESGADLMVIG